MAAYLQPIVGGIYRPSSIFDLVAFLIGLRERLDEPGADVLIAQAESQLQTGLNDRIHEERPKYDPVKEKAEFDRWKTDDKAAFDKWRFSSLRLDIDRKNLATLAGVLANDMTAPDPVGAHAHRLHELVGKMAKAAQRIYDRTPTLDGAPRAKAGPDIPNSPQKVYAGTTASSGPATPSDEGKPRLVPGYDDLLG
jgi:hypothetical protein